VSESPPPNQTKGRKGEEKKKGKKKRRKSKPPLRGKKKKKKLKSNHPFDDVEAFRGKKKKGQDGPGVSVPIKKPRHPLDWS